MPESVPIRGLFETHLTVADMERSVAFYSDVVGLELALSLPERGATFFWIGAPGRAMLGLWSLGSMPMGMSLHVAFDVALDDVLGAAERLRSLGVTPLSFFGAETDGAQRDRLDARGGAVLPRPRRAFARVPGHARRGAAGRAGDTALVRVVGAGRGLGRDAGLERNVGRARVAQQRAVLGDLVGAHAVERRRVGVEGHGGPVAGVADAVDGLAGDGHTSPASSVRLDGAA